MDILSVIQTHYMSFTNKERLIADYILSESQNIQNINISVLASRVGISDGTVTRFCKKIGCATFSDLKIQLSAGTLKNMPREHDPLKLVYNFYRQVVDRTDKMMDRQALERIIDEIRKARFIYLYGLGSSGLTANEFMLRLMRMGFQGQCITDTHLMIINSSLVSKDDLVIAFSVSGETTAVINSAAIARKNGCPVLCVTSFRNNTLSRNVDYCFVVANSELIERERIYNTQFSFLYLIDLLTAIFLESEEIKRKMNITVDTIIEESHVKKGKKRK